jgi:hypothetical protein
MSTSKETAGHGQANVPNRIESHSGIFITHYNYRALIGQAEEALVQTSGATSVTHIETDATYAYTAKARRGAPLLLPGS